MSGSHSELVKDPEGAYSQLIRLQEVSKESAQAADNQNKSEITADSFRQSSQKTASFLRSLSRGSSSRGNSSRHSFSVSLGLAPAVGIHDNAQAEPEQVPAQAPKVPLRRLAHLNKPEIPILALGTIAASVSGVILPLFGLLVSSVIKMFYEPPHEQKEDSEFWALMFVTVGVAALLAMPAQGYLFSMAGCKLIQRVRLMCFEKVVYMEVGWFDEPANSSGAIGARLSTDAARLRALVGDALAQMVQNIATAVAGLVIAFVACWQLAFIILALIPLIGLNGFIQIKFMKGFSADAKV